MNRPIMHILVVLVLTVVVVNGVHHPLVCEAGFQNELVAVTYGQSRTTTDQPGVNEVQQR
jgi:hypothetical protein